MTFDSVPWGVQIGILAILGLTAVGAPFAGLTLVPAAGRGRWAGACLIVLGIGAWIIAAFIVWPG